MNKTNNKNLLYILTVGLIFLLGIFIRILAFTRLNYYIIGDECHSIYGSIVSLKDIFTLFIQGTNFLPLYRLLLHNIWIYFGINWTLFKLPSLIASICSIFVFYLILTKLFKNKLLIISSLLLFCFNYTLILFSTRIKPYTTDVLFVLIIMYAAIFLFNKIKTQTLSFKDTLIYSIISMIFVYTSIPAIAYSQICFLGAVLYAFIKKTKKIFFKFFIYEFFVLGTILFEYFTYIKQIQTDNGLKEQWLTNQYFFMPNSFVAINSIIHFSFFEYKFFDIEITKTLPIYVLCVFLALFFIGSLNFIIKKSYKVEKYYIFIMVLLPVFSFITLSFLKLYPFCNRNILFIVPSIIIILINAFNFDTNKAIKILSSVLLIIFMSFNAAYIIKNGELAYLLKRNPIYKTVEKKLNFVESINSKDEIILSGENLCLYCTNNNNILILDPWNFEEGKNIRYYDRHLKQTKNEKSINDVIGKYKKIYYVYSNDIPQFNEKVLNEFKQPNYQKAENTIYIDGFYKMKIIINSKNEQ